MVLLSKRSGWEPTGLDGWATQGGAQADEYRVKAAFLYKFGSYIEWPSRSFARTDSPVAIGVMGANALADELAQIVAGRSEGPRLAHGHRIRRGAGARQHDQFRRGRRQGALRRRAASRRLGHPQNQRAPARRCPQSGVEAVMKLWSPRSLRQKLLGLVLLTTLVALVVALGALIGYDLRAYHRTLVSDMTTQAELLGRTIAPALAFDDPRVA